MWEDISRDAVCFRGGGVVVFVEPASCLKLRAGGTDSRDAALITYFVYRER